MTPKTIARTAEQLIASALPGSIYKNEPVDALLPYDLEWSGLRLDVKATTATKNGRAFFNIKVAPKHTGIILVFVCLEKPYRFWVSRYSETVAGSYRLDKALPISKLQAEIRSTAANPIQNISVYRRQSRQLTMRQMDFNILEEARQLIAGNLGIKVSPQSAIGYLANFYIKSIKKD
jgi:hypothetical protein